MLSQHTDIYFRTNAPFPNYIFINFCIMTLCVCIMCDIIISNLKSMRVYQNTIEQNFFARVDHFDGTWSSLLSQTMSVVAKHKAVEQQLYEYQVRQAGLVVFDTVAKGIHQRLRIFRTHHRECAARRRNALGYELRQETQRTEWLKSKYMDSVRQQQQPARLDSATNARGFGELVS